MLIGRMNKENSDIRRATVDFQQCWADSGESLQRFDGPVIELMGAWIPGPPMGFPDNTVPNVELPDDPTPLALDLAILLPGVNKIQLFFSEGTPGNIYRITLVGYGSSGRAQTVEIMMTVKEQPTG